MADDARGPPGALTPLIDPDMPLDISGNIDASSVNAEASPDVAALLAEADAVLGAVSDQLAEPSAASVSFASPARSPAGPVGSIAVSDAPLSPMTGAPQTPLSPTDTVFTAGTFGGTVLTPGSPSDEQPGSWPFYEADLHTDRLAGNKQRAVAKSSETHVVSLEEVFKGSPTALNVVSAPGRLKTRNAHSASAPTLKNAGAKVPTG